MSFALPSAETCVPVVATTSATSNCTLAQPSEHPELRSSTASYARPQMPSSGRSASTSGVYAKSTLITIGSVELGGGGGAARTADTSFQRGPWDDRSGGRQLLGTMRWPPITGTISNPTLPSRATPVTVAPTLANTSVPPVPNV